MKRVQFHVYSLIEFLIQPFVIMFIYFLLLYRTFQGKDVFKQLNPEKVLFNIFLTFPSHNNMRPKINCFFRRYLEKPLGHTLAYLASSSGGLTFSSNYLTHNSGQIKVASTVFGMEVARLGHPTDCQVRLFSLTQSFIFFVKSFRIVILYSRQS